MQLERSDSCLLMSSIFIVCSIDLLRCHKTTRIRKVKFCSQPSGLTTFYVSLFGPEPVQ